MYENIEELFQDILRSTPIEKLIELHQFAATVWMNSYSISLTWGKAYLVFYGTLDTKNIKLTQEQDTAFAKCCRQYAVGLC